ncbi:hypothetical protein ABZT04_19570 [Streptomyces sp. NPDC005492]|uniref:hypothetical protein n=1 Tax=Streptomyces sp. NPDC005492 TaxID=3156883 RepID=UPI0033BD3F9B
MGALRRRVALGMAVLATSGVIALAAPGTAQAASVCPGRRVATLPFDTGTVHVFRRNGYVCAYTVPEKAGGKRVMSVSVQARGNRPVVDRGRYIRRAGPVTVHAGHRCVRVEGAVGGGSVRSGWILC